MNSNMTTPDIVIRMELISLFSRFPNMEGCRKELAERLGREESQVERQLEELTSLKILKREYEGGSPKYRYIPAVTPVFMKRGYQAYINKTRQPGYFKYLME
jgi:predicted transcriptional regulator